jgi:hypothetical protein
MIRPSNFIIAILMLPLVGCQSGPTPTAGMSGLRVTVIAEPKTGVKDVSGRVGVYDTPAFKEQGQFERVDYSALDDIVVWAEPASLALRQPVLPPLMVEVNPKKSVENLSGAASIGQRLIVHNNGSTAGNFYSVSDGNEFDLGTIPAGGRGEYTIKSGGLIEILSASTKDPVAQVYAATSRWVALTHSEATVDFTDLPPGQYKIYSWHPRLPGSEVSVTISPNQVAKVSIKVGVNALPKVGPR